MASRVDSEFPLLEGGILVITEVAAGRPVVPELDCVSLMVSLLTYGTWSFL